MQCVRPQRRQKQSTTSAPSYGWIERQQSARAAHQLKAVKCAIVWLDREAARRASCSSAGGCRWLVEPTWFAGRSVRRWFAKHAVHAPLCLHAPACSAGRTTAQCGHQTTLSPTPRRLLPLLIVRTAALFGIIQRRDVRRLPLTACTSGGCVSPCAGEVTGSTDDCSRGPGSKVGNPGVHICATAPIHHAACAQARHCQPVLTSCPGGRMASAVMEAQ